MRLSEIAGRAGTGLDSLDDDDNSMGADDADDKMKKRMSRQLDMLSADWISLSCQKRKYSPPTSNIGEDAM